MRRKLTVLGTVLAVSLMAACTQVDVTGSTPEGVPSAPPPPAEATFAKAMGRISPDALGVQPMVKFGQTGQLLELGAADARWLDIAAMGNRLLPVDSSAGALGLAPDAADYAFEVGEGTQRIGLIAGGQDAEAITEAATGAGYEGTLVLTQEVDPSNPVTLAVQQIKPVEEDVVLAAADADVGWVDGGSLFADPEVAPAVACLGDVLAAMVVQLEGDIVGIGVRDEAGTALSLVCVPGGDDAIGRVEYALGGAEYAESIEISESAVVESDYAKVVVELAPDAPVDLLMTVASQQTLVNA